MISSIKVVVINILLILVLSNCQNNDNKTSSSEFDKDLILAKYSDNSVNINDMVSHIKSLPVKQRWNRKNTNSWFKMLLNNYIINEKLIKDANETKPEYIPDYNLNLRAINRLFYSSHYLSQNLDGNIITITDLLNYYNNNQQSFVIPDRRKVLHIYKKSKKNSVQTIELLLNLKSKINNQKDFEESAVKYSDSETRHKKGSLGILSKDSKNSLLNKIVFNLEKGEISEPIYLNEGYHLFYISDTRKGFKYSFDQAKQIIYELLNKEKKIKSIKDIALNLETPNFFSVISSNDLEYVKENNLVDEVLFNVNDYELTYGDLKTRLIIHKEYKGKLTIEQITYDLIEELASRELIYQHLQNNKLYMDLSNTDTKVIKLRNQLKVELFKKFKIIQSVTDKNLENYYNMNKNFYLSPYKFFYEEYKLPLNKNENLMPLLEGKVLELNTGKISFNDLIKKIDGNLTLLETNKLNVLNTKYLNFLSNLKVNKYSAPFTLDGHYYILKLNNLILPKQIEFSQVKPIVLQDYMNEHNDSLIKSLNQSLLSDVVYFDKNIDLFINNPTEF